LDIFVKFKKENTDKPNVTRQIMKVRKTRRSWSSWNY